MTKNNYMTLGDCSSCQRKEAWIVSLAGKCDGCFIKSESMRMINDARKEETASVRG